MRRDDFHRHIDIDGLAEGAIGIDLNAIGCANKHCRKLTATVSLVYDALSSRGGYISSGKIIGAFQIAGSMGYRSLPEYIPGPLREDYVEASQIRHLSPKASATLIRRCLQGMIRDFTGISRARLVDEINALRRLVDDGNAPAGVSPESVQAIDDVRAIGNIGAHMEKDINVVVDVDPDEAGLLIELTETLFDEWYIERNKRAQRFAKVAALAAEKKAELEAAKAAALDASVDQSPPVAEFQTSTTGSIQADTGGTTSE